MCGLAGYTGTHDPELLHRMSQIMAYRGPDDHGIWHDRQHGVGLAHRRLSIIDLSAAGQQPMASDDGSIVIAYNGEVYDFQEHRRTLEQEGVHFRSNTDTEVLLRLYETRSLAFLNQINGMFALAIWDSRARRLLLARDHAGVKPIYYWENGSRLFFASELKALLAIPDIPRRLNRAAIVDYLTFMWVPGQNTMLAGIKKLEPGCYLLWENGETNVRPWFGLSYEPDPALSCNDWVDAVTATFTQATRRQMVSDVPLGAYLSGGLDSSAIVACMRRAFPTRGITAYTARFTPGAIASEQGADDHPYAEAVAKHLGITLSSVDMNPDVIKLLPKLIYHLDEPDSDPAIFPSYLIAQQARRDGIKVLLSGTGGDEVFFGYRSHQALQLYQRLHGIFPRLIAATAGQAGRLTSSLLGASHSLPRRLLKFQRGLVALPGVARHLALVDWSNPETRQQLISDAEARQALADRFPPCLERYSGLFQGRGELNHHSHLLVQTFLAAHNFLYTDRSSMATSVEVRVPFMDVDLMRLAARIPEHFKLHRNVSKYVLKKAMEPYLPRQVIYRPKTGFGAPLRQWMQNDLKDVVQDCLSPDTVRGRGLFSAEAIARVMHDNASQKADHAYLLYALLNLEIWMRTFLDQPGKEAVF